MYLPNGSVLTVMTLIIPNYSSKHKIYNQTLYFPTFPLRDPDTVNTSLVPPHQFFCIKMWLWLTLLQVQYFWLPWDPPFSTIASTQCIEYVIDWDNHDLQTVCCIQLSDTKGSFCQLESWQSSAPIFDKKQNLFGWNKGEPPL